MYPLQLSHMTVVSSLGSGLAATLSALRTGRSGLRPCRFDTLDLPIYVGEVSAVPDRTLPVHLSTFACRNNQLAELAIVQDGFDQAVSGLVQRYGGTRIGLFLGTSTSGILTTEIAYRQRDRKESSLPASFDYQRTQNTASLKAYVSQRLGIDGPGFVVSCACASSAKTFGNAARMIAAGVCDAAIVGGADSLCLTTLYGFHALGLNAPGACRPFDAGRDGISIGEAAGFAILERPSQHPSDDDVLLFGVGESNDAYHMSSPHPEGIGARIAMERALSAAQFDPRDIDYINLHGTATRIGDSAEDMAVSALFGGNTPCSSTKGQTGHALGAAGIVEAIIAALAIRHGVLPGTANTEHVDPAFHCHYQLTPQKARVGTVLSNSFGFGGNNCSLVIGRPR